MRRVVKYFLILFGFIVFSAFIWLNTSPSVLDVSGYVLLDNNKVEGAIVKLYQDNIIVDKLITKKNGKFRFLLFSNFEYMLEISKPECVSERIYVNTKNEGDMDDKYYFEFVADLMKLKEFEGVDMSNLDYPTAIIKYDFDEDEYVHDKVYSKNVRADLRKMKEQKTN